jgi:hypothetical protein
MATYRFENHDIEFVNPTITVSSDNISIFPSNMTIDVDVLLEVAGARYGIRLHDVAVENLNYDPETLIVRVMARLTEYEV